MLSKLVLFLATVHISQSTLDPNFGKYIEQTYGAEARRQLERKDLGEKASFGGGTSAPTKHRPLVLVHGLRNYAGSLLDVRKAFGASGWTKQRILGTSYGPGETIVLESLKETMKCEYIKKVRTLLQATIDYYDSPIDVIGYSMGSPISRKAIMGGTCVDTKEYIGEPLTAKIVTFLAVAGANQGAYLCNNATPTGLCNAVNGMHCRAALYQDLNARNGYEGRNRYSIASTTDEITGHMVACGVRSSFYAGSNSTMMTGKTHFSMMHRTVKDQIEIIGRH